MDTNCIDAKGGITFFFHINQLQNQLYVTWAICHPKENFNKKRGMLISKGRFDKFYGSNILTDELIIMDYNRGLSLVDNVHEYMISYLAENLKHVKHIDALWSRELQTLFRTMNKINEMDLPWE